MNIVCEGDIILERLTIAPELVQERRAVDLLDLPILHDFRGFALDHPHPEIMRAFHDMKRSTIHEDHCGLPVVGARQLRDVGAQFVPHDLTDGGPGSIAGEEPSLTDQLQLKESLQEVFSVREHPQQVVVVVFLTEDLHRFEEEPDVLAREPRDDTLKILCWNARPPGVPSDRPASSRVGRNLEY